MHVDSGTQGEKGMERWVPDSNKKTVLGISNQFYLRGQRKRIYADEEKWGQESLNVKKKIISNKLQSMIPNLVHVSIIKLQNNFNCSDFHLPLSKG